VSITKARKLVQITALVIFLAIGMSNLTQFWIIISIMSIIGGQIFCGWICPFGLLQDLTCKLRNKLKIKATKVPKKVHNVLRYLRYVLYGVSLTGLGFILIKLSIFDPFSITQTLITYKTIKLVSSISLIVFVALSLFIDRFFCRYLCINGAQYSLLSFARIFSIGRTDKCVNCKKCERNCPMDIEVTKTEDINSIHCIRCHECVAVCPMDGAIKPRFKPRIINVLAVIILIFLTIRFSHDSEVVEEVDMSLYPENAVAIEVESEGYKGKMTVSVILSNDNIVDIIVTSHRDTVKYFNSAKAIIPDIISLNSSEASTVSGATYSSQGIIDAVGKAEIEYDKLKK